MTEIKKIVDKSLEKKFNIKISVKEINDEINKEAITQQGKIKIDGFRKGKVPVDFIKDKYSALLLTNTAESIVEKNTSQLIKENNFNLLSRPKIDVKLLEPEKDFEFEITFELLPEIPEIKYNKINLKKQKVKIDKKDIDEGKNKLLKTKATWKEKDKSYLAKNGDKVKIDFLGKLKDIPFEGGKAEGYDLELGSKNFIDTFEDQLVGKKSGDEIEVKVSFPKKYHKKELSGQAVTFDVKIHTISTSELPELNDKFLKENFNIETIEKLEEMIEKELTAMYENVSKNKIKNDIFEWLKKNVKVELPNSIINEEFERQWAPIENELKTNPDKFKTEKEKDKEKEEIRQNSEDSVKLGLILSEIGKVNNIKVEDTEIIQEIRKKAMAYPGQEQMILDFYMKNKPALNQITGLILEDKVIDFICEKATIEDLNVTAEEILK